MRLRLTALLIAVLAAVSLASCGDKATDSGKLKDSTQSYSAEGEQNSDGSSTNSDTQPSVENDGSVAVVNGEKIMPEDLGYYMYNNAVIQMYKINPGTTSEITSFDWSTTGEDGRPLKDIVEENALEDAVNDAAFRIMASEAGYSVSEAEKNASELVDGAISRSGEQGFLKTANSMGIRDAEQYKKIYTNIAVFDGVAKDFQNNPGKYISDISVLSDYTGTKGASVRQILILNNTSKGDALTVAQEVNQKAKNGEDFSELMREYNEDTVSETDGEDGRVYTFPEGEMVESFEQASFALKIGEISDIVKSDYGYHTIKRICGAYELQNYWRSEADVTISENAMDMIDFDDTINLIVQSKKTE